MKKSVIFFVFLIVTGINMNVVAQISGSKSIPGDYATITDAILALDTAGVGSGGVTFNVAAGHNETASNLVIAFTANPPTASNPVIFQKSGAGANPLITAAAGTSATLDGIIKMSGADYITFDGIDLLDPVSNTGNAMMEWGYVLLRGSTTDGSQNNIIKNCTITLQKANTNSIGIYIANENLAGTAVAADTVGGNTDGFNSNNKIYGCSISDVDIGIFAKSVTNIRDRNNEIGVNGQTANNITNWGGSQVTAGLSHGIRCEGQSNLKISNNIINGGIGTGGSSSVVGIMVTSSGTGTNLATYEISYNTVTVITSVTSQGTWAIRALGTGDTVRIHHNIVEDCNAVQNTTTFSAIALDWVGTTNIAFVHDNIVRNNSHSGTGSSTLLGGTAITTTSHIYDNQVYGNRKTGISGIMYCIRSGSGLTNCRSNLIYDNAIPNSSGTSSSQVYGYRNDDTDPATENIYENTIYQLSVGGSNTSTSSIVTGIRVSGNAGSVRNIYDNAIYNLSGVSGTTTTGGVIGIFSTAGSANDIYRNKISNITNTGSTGTSFGCWVSSGTSIKIYNNVISDIKAPNSGNVNGVVGINSTSTATNSTIEVYDNSIYLSAAGGSTFGSSGVSVAGNATATTASLIMRHNNIINLSSPGSSSGNTVAYRRSSTALANYALTSDSNNFFAGTPASNRLIFFDGTSGDQLLSDYKTRVSPRDANSTSMQNKTLTLKINLEVCAQTDTIYAEIRKASPPYNILDSAKGLGGLGNAHVFNFEKPVDGVSYYIVVKHRNSIATWSKSGGEVFTGGTLNFDFTSAASQAYDNNQVLVGSNYSIYTGDVNQDGIVDLSDIIAIYNDAGNFVTGYVVTDLNCNNIVDLADLLFAYNNSSIFVSVKRP